MTGLTALLLPIVIATVVVFIASSVIHMLIPWHKSDYPRLPQEDQFRAAVGPLDIPPGDYMIPRAHSREEMQSPEFLKRLEDGPVVSMTVSKRGMPSMANSLVGWFIYCLLVSIFAAYITGRALGAGVEYLEVFRFAGTTAFMGYSFALLQMSIWYRRSWNITFKSMIDGLIYALLTAGVFGWLWP